MTKERFSDITNLAYSLDKSFDPVRKDAAKALHDLMANKKILERTLSRISRQYIEVKAQVEGHVD